MIRRLPQDFASLWSWLKVFELIHRLGPRALAWLCRFNLRRLDNALLLVFVPLLLLVLRPRTILFALHLHLERTSTPLPISATGTGLMFIWIITGWYGVSRSNLSWWCEFTSEGSAAIPRLYTILHYFDRMLSYCLLILNYHSAELEFRRATTSQYIVLHGTLHLEFTAGTRDFIQFCITLIGCYLIVF